MGIILMPKSWGTILALRDALAITVGLRTAHRRYLRRMADHQDISLSDAFGAILDEYASVLPSAQAPRKELTHLRLDAPRIAILNKLSATMAVSKAEVARRIIDEARQRAVFNPAG